jgi:hypothetical protein
MDFFFSLSLDLHLAGKSTCNCAGAFPSVDHIDILFHSILRPAEEILSEALALPRVVTCEPTGSRYLMKGSFK